MQLRAVLFCCTLIIVGSPSAFAQHYTYADWAELRRRLALGLDTSALLKQYAVRSSRVSPAAWNRTPFTWTLDERRRLVRDLACESRVPPALALAIVEQESGFDPSAVGQFGELGASQILPSTADEYGLDRERLMTDYEYNVRGGVTIMRSLLDQFPESAAIAAYNGGPNFGASPPHVQEKVQRYVAGVLARKGKYEGVQCD